MGRFLLALLTAFAAASGAPQDAAPGAVVAVGGGGTPDSVVVETLRIARSRTETPTVVVVPFASTREDRGVGSVEMWAEAGANAILLTADARADRRALEQADVIWMSGGDQDRLLDDLERLDLVETIQARHRSGAVVGGTSAGAAVLGTRSIAGRPDPGPYVVGGMEGRPGLGLVPDAIVDQHFRERTREGRLLTAVLDAGGVLGLGVSERTAAIIEGGEMRVMGEGVVVAFDARDAEIADGEAGAARSASGVVTAVHPAGSRRPLDE
ncbi:MAG: cyanophycinase [Planctomycetota bacterium]